MKSLFVDKFWADDSEVAEFMDELVEILSMEDDPIEIVYLEYGELKDKFFVFPEKIQIVQRKHLDMMLHGKCKVRLLVDANECGQEWFKRVAGK